ncbi:hypothetical protein J2Y63_005726 [Shinella sp. BE166]|uniref:hypothetical protein n=1 Tax=Shinella sp. BE166 TaxID=3373918 RepID=UPI003EB8A6D5
MKQVWQDACRRISGGPSGIASKTLVGQTLDAENAVRAGVGIGNLDHYSAASLYTPGSVVSCLTAAWAWRSCSAADRFAGGIVARGIKAGNGGGTGEAVSRRIAFT